MADAEHLKESAQRLRETALFLLPVVVLFVPYWFWRYAYFGFFFPNAFYAKSIALPYYEQGWVYTSLFIRSYWIFLLLVPACAPPMTQRDCLQPGDNFLSGGIVSVENVLRGRRTAFFFLRPLKDRL